MPTACGNSVASTDEQTQKYGTPILFGAVAHLASQICDAERICLLNSVCARKSGEGISVIANAKPKMGTLSNLSPAFREPKVKLPQPS